MRSYGSSRARRSQRLARELPPARRIAPSKLDPYKPVIRQKLEDDARNRRKQPFNKLR